MRKCALFAVPCAMAMLCAGRSIGEQFGIVEFPEAAYANERVTFAARGEPGMEVEVGMDGRKIAEARFAGSRLEVNLTLSESGMLTFRFATNTVSFHVVKPSDAVRLVEKDGYLRSEMAAAILLAAHRHPPKHDRRWEVPRVVARALADVRPIVRSGCLIGAEFLRRTELRRLSGDSASGTAFWTRIRADGGLSEINSMIGALSSLPRASDVAVVAVSARDCEQGTDELQLRIKFEWYLQALGQGLFKHVFVVAPPMDDRQQRRFPYLYESMRLSAAGNGAVCIKASFDSGQQTGGDDWFEQVVDHITKTVRFE